MKKLLIIGALGVFVGCTSTKVYDPSTGNQILSRVNLLAKNDIKTISAPGWQMTGYRNDGGADALEQMMTFLQSYMIAQLPKVPQQQPVLPLPVIVPVTPEVSVVTNTPTQNTNSIAIPTFPDAIP